MLRASAADPIRFYSETWDWNCLPSITSALRVPGESHLSSSPLFIEMMTAISASHLSRTSPQRRLLLASHPAGMNHRPDPGHESVSHEFYGAVMRKLASWTDSDFSSNPILGLVVLTLFCHLESSMGSFEAFGLHSKGATKLIQSYAAKSLEKDGRASDLLGSLVEVRMQMWWRRVYFGTPEFHRNRPKVSFGPGFERILVFDSKRAALLLILCESHRINNAGIIAHWDHNNVASLDSDGQETESQPPHNDSTFSTPEAAIKLDTEAINLENWRNVYPLSGIIDDTEQSSIDKLDKTTLDIQPVHMDSHEDAMNFAYYISCRVLQCPGPLESLNAENPDEIAQAYHEAEAWTRLLLRALAGMKWDNCIRFNMYTIGVTGLLLACILRTHDPSLGKWCEQWLQRCLDGKSFEEGSFPAFQTLEIIRLVNAERRRGYDVLSLFQTVEDGGGTGKFGSYQSQALSSLLVYGRCRRTGQPYSYCKSMQYI